MFQEGLRLPPCRLYRAGEPNQELFEVIAANCRVPELVIGGLTIDGTHWIGARRLREFLEDYDLEDLRPLAHEIHGRSEAAMRSRVEALADGRYEFGLDIDGYVETVHLHATVDVRGSDVFVDYAGSSPQTGVAAINCVFHTTFASTMFPFKCALVPAIPNNEGLFRPIHVSAPPGSILNTSVPAPGEVAGQDHEQPQPGDLRRPVADPRRARAGGERVDLAVHAEGRRGALRAVRRRHAAPRRAGAAELDGLVPIAFPHNSVVTPCEIVEIKAPVLFLRKELRPDSAGDGRRRGGLGQTIVLRHIGEREMILSLIPDKVVCEPPGLAGGRPGTRGEVLLNGVRLERFPPIHFRPGDELELRLPGAGGFGPPEEREPELAAHDAAMGYVTPKRR